MLDRILAAIVIGVTALLILLLVFIVAATLSPTHAADSGSARGHSLAVQREAWHTK